MVLVKVRVDVAHCMVSRTRQ